MANAQEMAIVLRARGGSDVAREFGQVTTAAQHTASSVGGSVDSINRKLSSIQASAAVAAAGTVAQFAQMGAQIAQRFVQSTVGVGVGFNVMAEQAKIAFTQMLGGGDKATVMLQGLQKLAIESPLELPAVRQGAQTLLAMGFAGEKVLPIMTLLTDAASTFGGNMADRINHITLALGQMASSTKVNAQDMNQLIQAGIPAWQALADASKKSVAQVKADAENGLIAGAQGVNAILAYIERNFAGMAAKQGETLGGLFSSMKDLFAQAAGGIIDPFTTRLRDRLAGLVAGAQGAGFQDQLKTMVSGINDTLDQIGNISSAHGMNLLDSSLATISMRLKEMSGEGASAMFDRVTRALGDTASMAGTAAKAVWDLGQKFAAAAVNGTSFADGLGPVGSALDVIRGALERLGPHRELLVGLAAAFIGFQVLTAVVPMVLGFAAAMNALFAAFAVGGAAAGIGSVIALLGGPFTLAIVGVSVAIGLLVSAWAGNWGNIQAKTAAVVGDLITKFGELQQSLSGLTTPKLQAFDDTNIVERVRKTVDAVMVLLDKPISWNGLADIARNLNWDNLKLPPLPPIEMPKINWENLKLPSFPPIEIKAQWATLAPPPIPTIPPIEIKLNWGNLALPSLPPIEGPEINWGNLALPPLPPIQGPEIKWERLALPPMPSIEGTGLEAAVKHVNDLTRSIPVLGGVVGGVMDKMASGTGLWRMQVEGTQKVIDIIRTVSVPGVGLALAAIEKSGVLDRIKGHFTDIGKRVDEDALKVRNLANEMMAGVKVFQGMGSPGANGPFPIPSQDADESIDRYLERVNSVIDTNLRLEDIQTRAAAAEAERRRVADAAAGSARIDESGGGGGGEVKIPKVTNTAQAVAQSAIEGFMATLASNEANFKAAFSDLGAKAASALSTAIGNNEGGAGASAARALEDMVTKLREIGVADWRQLGDDLASSFHDALIARTDETKAAALAKLAEIDAILKRGDVFDTANLSAQISKAIQGSNMGSGAGLMDSLETAIREGGANVIKQVATTAVGIRDTLVNGFPLEQAERWANDVFGALSRVAEEKSEEAMDALRGLLTFINTQGQVIKARIEADTRINVALEDTALAIKAATDATEQQVAALHRELAITREIRAERETMTDRQSGELEGEQAMIAARVAGHARWREDINQRIAGERQIADLIKGFADSSAERQISRERQIADARRQNEPRGVQQLSKIGDMTIGNVAARPVIDDVKRKFAQEDADIARREAKQLSDLQARIDLARTDREQARTDQTLDAQFAKDLQDGLQVIRLRHRGEIHAFDTKEENRQLNDRIADIESKLGPAILKMQNDLNALIATQNQSVQTIVDRMALLSRLDWSGMEGAFERSAGYAERAAKAWNDAKGGGKPGSDGDDLAPGSPGKRDKWKDGEGGGVPAPVVQGIYNQYGPVVGVEGGMQAVTDQIFVPALVAGIQRGSLISG